MKTLDEIREAIDELRDSIKQTEKRNEALVAEWERISGDNAVYERLIHDNKNLIRLNQAQINALEWVITIKVELDHSYTNEYGMKFDVYRVDVGGGNERFFEFYDTGMSKSQIVEEIMNEL